MSVALTGRQFPIAAGRFHAVVVEVGAGLRAFSEADRPVTCNYDEDVLPPKGCGAVLVPWPNRIRDGSYDFDAAHYQLPLTDPPTSTAIHGLARWARWRPTEHTLSAVTLALDVVPQTGYPFEVRVEVRYELDEAEGLQISVVARNVGERRAPFGAGFHPYVSAGAAALDELTVQLPAQTQLLLDDRSLPVGRRPVAGTDRDLRSGLLLGATRLDDAFTDLAPAEGIVRASVRRPDGGAEIWFDDAFGYAQVFTHDFGGGQAGVAIEPMSCPADAFNSGDGLVVLEPAASWQGRWGIRPLSA